MKTKSRIALIFISLGGILVSVILVLRVSDSLTRRKYTVTAQMMREAVSPVDRIVNLKRDAWGHPFIVSTNAEGIIAIISRGRDGKDKKDDIRLEYLPFIGTFSILYSFDSYLSGSSTVGYGEFFENKGT